MDSVDPMLDLGEPDLYWAGPSGRALLPIVIAVGIVSGLSWLAVPRLAAVLGLNHEWTSYILFQTILISWIAFGLHWAYRASSVVARLTPRHIYLDYGFLYCPTPPLDLVEIAHVHCHVGPLNRLIRIGNVVVITVTKRKVKFVGIARPQLFAEAIRTAMQKAKIS